METLKLQDTIAFYRKRQGLTQEELARKLGVTNQAVSKWESAQCCPDIYLLPLLADVFAISIDELFGRPCEKEIHYDLCSELPWNDDNTIRVFRTLGKKILQTTDENGWINVSFPDECYKTAEGYFKVEVFGHMRCDADIYGDVTGHGNIACKQIHGDVRECRNNISCGGDINGAVNCGDNLACGRSIHGAVNCGDHVSCGKSITGDVQCGGNVECQTIEGNVECHGDILYR